MDQGIGGTGFATDDDLDPARGIIHGLMLIVPFWMAVVVCWRVML